MTIWQEYNKTLRDEYIPMRLFDIGDMVQLVSWYEVERAIIIWYELYIKNFSSLLEETHWQYKVYTYDDWKEQVWHYSERFIKSKIRNINNY